MQSISSEESVADALTVALGLESPPFGRRERTCHTDAGEVLRHDDKQIGLTCTNKRYSPWRQTETDRLVAGLVFLFQADSVDSA